MKLKYFLQAGSFLIAVVLWSCSGNNSETGNKTGDNNQSTGADKSLYIKFNKPNSSDDFVIGNTIEFDISIDEKIGKVDSLVLSNGEKNIAVLKSAPYKFSWDTKSEKVGLWTIKAAVYSGKEKTESSSMELLILSDIVPQTLKYTIVKTFNHDPSSYTQGLIFDNGYFYEGTGEYGSSALRKNKIENGESLKSTSLSNEFFGEGIAMYNNKIYQLTWQNQVGFIYEKESFKQVGKFNYNGEGWGLTFNGKNFIMSDGSAVLYFISPENFQEIGRIIVCDNKGLIRNLNELEYINGEIFANVYQTDDIVVVDPATGKVTKKINLANIFDAKNYNGKIDVLNGIAWDEKGKRLFVTGKWWPKLFQIEVK